MRRKHDNSEGTTSSPPRDANAASRAALAVKLRASKMTYEQIAQQCGYSDKASCYNAVQRELQRVVVSNVDDLRREELYTLDVLQQKCFTFLLDDKNKGKLFAVDRILAIQERRAKLMGLDVTKDSTLVGAQVVVRAVPPGYGEKDTPS